MRSNNVSSAVSQTLFGSWQIDQVDQPVKGFSAVCVFGRLLLTTTPHTHLPTYIHVTKLPKQGGIYMHTHTCQVGISIRFATYVFPYIPQAHGT